MAGRPRSLRPIDRFNEKYDYDESSGCWLWTGSCVRGYGTFSFNGRKVRAARWIYEYHVDDIPEGFEVDHLCRQRWCVNPEHLELVTHAENMRRARLEVCRAGLHDLADPANRNPGVRGCYACKKDRMRQRYAEEPEYRATMKQRATTRYARTKGGGQS